MDQAKQRKYKPKPMPNAMRQAAVGSLIGMSAPVVYVFISFLISRPQDIDFTAWCFFLFQEKHMVLVELTIYGMLFLCFFGYFIGVKQDKLVERSQQVEEFLHVAVHDIKSPIAIIRASAQIVEDGTCGPINEKQLKMLNAITRQSSVMVELVSEFLDLRKLETGLHRLNLQATTLIKLVEKAVGEMEVLANKKSIRTEIRSEIPDGTMVQLDRFRIRQVFRNILLNAIRYVPNQGLISIVARHNRKGEVELTFYNNGPHIPKERLKVIFDKFAQSQGPEKKLRVIMGLTICKNIIDAHGGRIWIENVNPTGVRFHLCFPS